MPFLQEQAELALDRVVLATDFSPVSEVAAGYARGLSKRFASSLSLAHVIDLSVGTMCGDAVLGYPMEEVRRVNARSQQELMEEMTLAGVRTTVHLLEAQDPCSSLVSFAQGLRADLIVTGTNARKGLSKMIAGSFAEGVIRHAECAVLTVGPKARAASKGSLFFRKIVFATDFGADARRQAAMAFRFAKDSFAEVTLCHVVERRGKDISETLGMEIRADAELEKLIPAAAQQWCNAECVVESGDVGTRILEVARTRKADLIVLGARPDQFWFTHVFEGTIGQVLTEAECPVLSLRGK